MKLKSAVIIMMVLFTGCGQGMKNHSRTKPFQKDNFFKDGSSARPLVEGTVARGQLKYPTPLYTGKDHGQFVSQSPVPITRPFLERGQDRYNIYCAVCHDRLGEGNGMIVQRGFPRPASFYTGRLRHAPLGYFFDVISNGKGPMAPNRDVLDEHDRWAIAAYIRVLQTSREAPLSEAPEQVQKKLNSLKGEDQRPVYE